MTANEARQHVSAYLDGELDEATRRAVEQALAADAELRAEADALGRTAELAASLPRVPAPAGFAARVAAALESEGAGSADPVPASPLRRWRHLLSAAAACLVIGIAAVAVLRTRPPRDKALGAPRQPATESTATRTAAPPVGDRYHDGAFAERAKTGPHDSGAKASYGAAKLDDDPKRGAVWAAKAEQAEGPSTDGAGDPESKDLAPKAAPAPPEMRFAKGGGAGRAPAREADTMGFAPGEARGRDRDAFDKALRDETAFGGRATGVDKELFAAIVQRKSRVALAPEALVRGPNGARRPRPSAKAEGTAPQVAPAPAPPQAPPPEAEEQGGLAAGRDQPGAPVLRHELRYVDLQARLAAVQAALSDARVPFVIQPLGAGQFVVAADLERGQALALLDRLAGADDVAARQTRAPAKPATALDHRARAVANGSTHRPTVRLVVRFRPARPPEAAP